MLVKTLTGKLGRIEKTNKSGGNIKVKVLLLNENMHQVYKHDEPIHEFHFIYDLIFRPKVIVQI